MKRTEHPLFLLTQTGALPHGTLSQDMVDALNDPTVMSYAPGILSIICEWMDLNQTHNFTISASTEKSYHLDLSFSFLACLEQLPQLATWLNDAERSVYHLDINNQGFDLRVELIRIEDRIRHTCIEDHWQTATRIEGDNDITPDSLRSSCKLIVQGVAAVAAALDIAKMPAFQDWCAKCGCHPTE